MYQYDVNTSATYVQVYARKTFKRLFISLVVAHLSHDIRNAVRNIAMLYVKLTG